MPGLIGKKVGMTSIFDEKGNNVPCTILEVGPCVITQIKTVENDGYQACSFHSMKRRKRTQPGP